MHYAPHAPAGKDNALKNHFHWAKSLIDYDYFHTFIKTNYNNPNASQVDRASNSASLQRWR